MRCFVAAFAWLFSVAVLALVRKELRRWYADIEAGRPNRNRFADALALKDAALEACPEGKVKSALREYGHLDPAGYRE